MNSLFQQLNPTPNNLQRYIEGMKNPKQFLMKAAQSDPKVKNTLDLIKMSNKSPKDLFYEEARKQGVDPNTILNMLR